MSEILDCKGIRMDLYLLWQVYVLLNFFHVSYMCHTNILVPFLP